MGKGKKIVVIGGGTGVYTVLSGLKKYPVDLSAIVSMTDSGGSNRVIRDEFGLLPTSDIRQVMVALASDKSSDLLRNLFTYRYNRGTGIAGMTFGNLFMAALTDIYGSQEEAIEKTSEILGVQGQILPVTFDNSHLVARYDNGEQVIGEHYIDEADERLGKHRIVELEVIPKAKANPKALTTLKKADLIILGPGDLYTSIISNLVVDEVAKAIRKSKATKVFIVNLMTKFGQTNDFSAKDHVWELEKYLGKGVIEVCLVNKQSLRPSGQKTKKYPRGVLMRYKEENAIPVKDDLGSGNSLRVIRRSFISRRVFEKPKSDKLQRSLIRHESDRLAKAIMSLL